MKKMFRLFISALIAINVLSVPVFATNQEIEPRRWTDYTTYEGYHIHAEEGFELWGSVTLAYTYNSSGKTVKVHSYTIEADASTEIQILSSFTTPAKGVSVNISDFPNNVVITATVRLNGTTKTGFVSIPVSY